MAVTQVERRLRLDQADPQPAHDYQSALERFARLQSLDGDDVNPICRSRLLAHSARTERTVLLLHGMTNCPEQFAQLAPQLYGLGYNVLVPRLPRNGLADRMTEDLKFLTAEELRAFCDAMVDVACGLGERVTVLGLSAGGVLAAWMAQFRPEVETAIVIAPSLGILPSLPIGNMAANRLLMRAMSGLPNLMTRRIIRYENRLPYNYVGFATRGLGAMMRLSFVTLGAARRAPPAAQRIVMVVNDGDTAISNALALTLARRWHRWQARRGTDVSTYRFPASLALIHDVIDPQQKAQQIDRVYPVLLDLIADSTPVGDERRADASTRPLWL